MATGLSPASIASRLNLYRGTSYTAPAGVYVKLHIGDPGAAGTANASANTTRNQATWSAPSGNSMALSSLASFTMTATETITYGSFWDAATAGNFLESFQLSSGVPVISGSTLTFSSLPITEGPAAA